MKISHQPDVLTSFSGRTDEASSPNVGIVQNRTRAYTIHRPPRLERAALTERPIGSPPIAASTTLSEGSAPSATPGGTAIGSATTLGVSPGLTVLMPASPLPGAVPVGSSR